MNLATAAGKLLLLNTYVNLSATNSIPTALTGIQAMIGYVDYVPYGSTAVPVFGTIIPNLTVTSAAKRIYNDATKVIKYTFDV
jgi:hypothetical protein